jgi:hypothetical protein
MVSLTLIMSFITIFLLIVFALTARISTNSDKMSKKGETLHKKGENIITVNEETCDKNTCDAMDPVSDPDYNMRQIVKQSILVEEHLTQDRKRCKDCITKHLLHIQGLAEEAAMLAGSSVDKYPYLLECVPFYDDLFIRWIKEGRENIEVQLEIATELRKMRKILIATYFLQNPVS